MSATNILKRFGSTFEAFSLENECSANSSSVKANDDGFIGNASTGDLYNGTLEGDDVVFQVSQISDEISLNKLQTELTVLRSLNGAHLNIVPMLGVASSESIITSIYDLKNSMNLYTAVYDFELPWTLRLQLCFDITSAINFLHESNITHRSINLNNILVDEDWHAKVSGFSESCSTKQCDNIPLTKKITIEDDSCVSPELLIGRSHNSATDIFSLTAVIFTVISMDSSTLDHEIETGTTTNPFRKRNSSNGYVVDENSIITSLPKDCPDDIKSLLLECTSTEPTTRFQAIEIVSVLQEIEVPEEGNNGNTAPTPTHNHNHGSPTTTVATNSIVDKNTSIPPTISEDEARNREANASAAAATAAVLKQSEEMNEMKSMIQELQQQILGLKEENIKLSDVATNKINDTNTDNNNKDDKVIDDKDETQKVINAWLKVIEKCDAKPSDNNNSSPNISSPTTLSDATPDWVMAAAYNPGMNTLINTKYKKEFSNSTSKGYNTHNTSSHVNRSYNTNTSFNSHGRLNMSAIARVKKSVSRVGTGFSPLTEHDIHERYQTNTSSLAASGKQKPLTRRRLSPEKDPRTPPRKGPGSRPTQGEYGRSVGSIGTPYILNADSYLARNFFRADDPQINKERWKESHEIKNPKTFKNDLFLAGKDSTLKCPQRSVIQSDMAASLAWNENHKGNN